MFNWEIGRMESIEFPENLINIHISAFLIIEKCKKFNSQGGIN
jgi:hypothetical protein